MLTDRYLDGIPPDSRAGREGTALDRGAADRRDAREGARPQRDRGGPRPVTRADGDRVDRSATAVTSALIGASSVEQLETNVAALDRLDFSDDELAEIDRYATETDINLWARSSSAE